jgi:hypothetical protein
VISVAKSSDTSVPLSWFASISSTFTGARRFHTTYIVRPGNEASGRVDVVAMLSHTGVA